MERLKHMKESLMCCLEAQMNRLSEVDAKEMGEVVDMVKDLEEAMYYHTVTKAMEGKEKTAPFTGSITLDSRRTALVVCGEASEAERLQKTLKKISTFTPGIPRTEFNKKHLKEYLNK